MTSPHSIAAIDIDELGEPDDLPGAVLVLLLPTYFLNHLLCNILVDGRAYVGSFAQNDIERPDQLLLRVRLQHVPSGAGAKSAAHEFARRVERQE
jgi:hypothetical protein